MDLKHGPTGNPRENGRVDNANRYHEIRNAGSEDRHDHKRHEDIGEGKQDFDEL
jgi:hypothetical protein